MSKRKQYEEEEISLIRCCDFVSQNCRPIYEKHIQLCFLCSKRTIHEAEKVCFQLYLPCGNYFTFIHHDLFMQHYKNCEQCQMHLPPFENYFPKDILRTQTERLDMITKMNEITSKAEEQFDKITKSKQLQDFNRGHVPDSLKSKLCAATLYSEYLKLLLKDVETAVERLGGEWIPQGKQLRYRQRYLNLSYDNLCPLAWIKCIQGKSILNKKLQSRSIIEYNFESLHVKNADSKGKLIPSGYTTFYPYYIQELVSGKYVMEPTFSKVIGTKSLDDISVLWYFDQVRSPNASISFRLWMAFETTGCLWNCFTRCVEAYITQQIQNETRNQASIYIGTVCVDIVNQYNAVSHCLFVLLFIIVLFDSLHFEKERLFSSYHFKNIYILINNVETEDIQVKSAAANMYKFKKNVIVWGEDFAMRKQAHHDACNELMKRFIMDNKHLIP